MINNNCFEKDELVRKYRDIVDMWGIWNSEESLIRKYCANCKTILDIGCGTGRVATALSELWFDKVVGIDISMSMIECSRMLVGKDDRLSFVCADITNMHSIGEFDAAIFAYNGIMSIIGRSNRIKALNNIYRMLTPGGIFIFTTHRGVDDQESEYRAFWDSRRKVFFEKGLSVSEDNFFTIEVEDKGEKIYQFFANDTDIIGELKHCGFIILDTFLRDSRYIEKECVLQETNNCRMWVCKRADK